MSTTAALKKSIFFMGEEWLKNNGNETAEKETKAWKHKALLQQWYLSTTEYTVSHEIMHFTVHVLPFVESVLIKMYIEKFY